MATKETKEEWTDEHGVRWYRDGNRVGQKVKYVPTNTNEEWGKRFDELVMSDNEYRSDVWPKDMKHFIQQELDSQRQPIYEEVIELVTEIVERERSAVNYKSIISEILTQLRNKINE